MHIYSVFCNSMHFMEVYTGFLWLFVFRRSEGRRGQRGRRRLLVPGAGGQHSASELRASDDHATDAHGKATAAAGRAALQGAEQPIVM
jgi:hypothetical protein